MPTCHLHLAYRLRLCGTVAPFPHIRLWQDGLPPFLTKIFFWFYPTVHVNARKCLAIADNYFLLIKQPSMIRGENFVVQSPPPPPQKNYVRLKLSARLLVYALASDTVLAP